VVTAGRTVAPLPQVGDFSSFWSIIVFASMRKYDWTIYCVSVLTFYVSAIVVVVAAAAAADNDDEVLLLFLLWFLCYFLCCNCNFYTVLLLIMILF
jgi:hypothetical protein